MRGPQVRVKVGGSAKLVRILRKTRLRKGKAFNRGLKKTGAFLLEKSREVVPVDTGFLHSSGYTRTRGRGFNAEQETGYTAPYAIYVHEDLSMNHKPGKIAKYLEKPARQYSRDMARIMREELVKP